MHKLGLVKGAAILVAPTIFAVQAVASVSVSVAAPVAPAPATVVAPAIAPMVPEASAVLRTGTEVPLKMAEGLTTQNKAVRVGQRFHLTVAEDVKVNGYTVIPVGSPAMGEVTSVRNKGMWGKSGHIAAQILYVEVNGREIRLTGTFDDKGVTGTAGVVAAVVFVPIAGFFTTGTSANIPAGSGVKGFVGEDVPLNLAAVTQPAPMAVAVVAPATSAPAPVPAAVAITPVAAQAAAASTMP